MIFAATPALLAGALGLLGLAVGLVLARISLRLPAAAPASAPVEGPGVRYPLLAVAAAGAGVWAGLAQPSVAAAILTALLGWQLLLIAVVDGEHFWLPDRLTLPLLATGLAAAAILNGLSLADSLAGAAFGFATLWLLARAYRRLRGREGLGGGDPFLLAGAGAWVGWIGLPSVLLWAALAGLSVAAAQVATGRRVSGSDRLPFGVFLAVATWLTWLFGPLGIGLAR